MNQVLEGEWASTRRAQAFKRPALDRPVHTALPRPAAALLRPCLQAVAESLGPAGLERVAQEAADLQAWQAAPNSPENLAKIPSLEVSGKAARCRMLPLFRGAAATAQGCHTVGMVQAPVVD